MAPPRACGDYAGKVLLVVNVASKCGLTPQYEGLEKLYRAKRDHGLEVLGFPANDFRDQEPGADEEIETFCTTTFNVKFPMFSKINVIGATPAPALRGADGRPAADGPVRRMGSA